MTRALAMFAIALSIGGCSDDSPGDERCVAGRSEPCMLPEGPGVRMCGPDFRWTTCGVAPDAGMPVGPALPAPPAAPMPPAEAALPVLTPCPTGWREIAPIDEDDVATCDPWPEAGRADCPDGEAHFPGEPGCSRIGSECPADGFPAGLAGTDVRYVDDDASAGGDGTRAQPFETINDALAGATDETVVGIATGSYSEVLLLPDGVTLVGACPAETRLQTPGPEAAVTAEGDVSGSIRNLQIGGQSFGVLVRAGSSIELDEVWIHQASRVAINLGGRAALRNVVIDETAPGGSSSVGRAANLLGAGAFLSISRGVLADNSDGGIVASDESQIVLEDVAILDTDVNPMGFRGDGILVQTGAGVELNRAVLERNHATGIVCGAGTVVATDTVVADTLPALFGGRLDGRGIDINAGCQVTLTRVLSEGHQDAALNVGGATVTMQDVVLRNVSGNPEGQQGFGGAIASSTGTVERIFVRNVQRIGLSIRGFSAGVSFSDVVITDVAQSSDPDPIGYGFRVFEAGVASIDRLRVRRAAVAGAVIGSPFTNVIIRDAVIEESGSGAPATTRDRLELGVAVLDEAQLTLERATIADSGQVGLQVIGADTAVTLSDVAILGTYGYAGIPPVEGPLEPGVAGVTVLSGARLDWTRGVVDSASELGVAVSGDNTSAELIDLIVSNTGPTPSNTLGRGLASQLGATVRVERARFERNQSIGVSAQSCATVELIDTVVAETRPGLNGTFGRGVEVDTFPEISDLFCADFARLSLTRVLISDNFDMGAAAYGEGAVLEASALVIERTQQRACVSTGACSDDLFGGGFGAYKGASGVLTDFVIRDSALFGLQIANGGELDASDGIVSGHPVGANVQSPDFDRARISARVSYADNDAPIDGAALPIPTGLVP